MTEYDTKTGSPTDTDPQRTAEPIGRRGTRLESNPRVVHKQTQ